MVDNFEGVDDERVVGAADAVTDEFEEAGVDDLAIFEVSLFAGGAVGNADDAGAGLFVVEGLAGSGRADAHVVVLDVGVEDALGGGGPFVEVGFDPVGVGFEEGGQFGGLVGAGDVGGADESGDDGGEGGGRVAGGLLPTLLLGDGGVLDEEGGGALDEGNDVEVAEGVELGKTPRKHDGEGHFVELDAGPVGGAVDPEVLGEAAVGTLGAGEVDEGAKGRVGTVAGEEGSGGLNHVAGPDEVVATEVRVAFGGSPGDGGGGDEGSGIGLVLVGEEGVVADAHEGAAVGGSGDQTLRRGGAAPLNEEASAVNIERGGEALHHLGDGGVVAVTECDCDGEFAVAGDVDLPHDGDVAVEGFAELPGHLHVAAEVLKAVAGTYVAAGGAGESAV